MTQQRMCIIGVGNIGSAIARGLVDVGGIPPHRITLTRRKRSFLAEYEDRGFVVKTGNPEAIEGADVIVLAVRPRQVNGVLHELAPHLKARRPLLISVVSGISIQQIKALVGAEIDVVRAMPNTAIAIGESMTCLATESPNGNVLKAARAIFDTVGKTQVIDEEQMIPATALAACGVAFFLRAIRAASQGGIEIGFHSEIALRIAAQTAKGAASLLLDRSNHPEAEIDKVTTPRGCTISGLNRMEHEGLSSALIKGIVTSAEKAGDLYVANHTSHENQ